ncbi:MAG: GDSL-type esterase/lipase family protein [Bacteroidota bacterium]
MRLYIFLFLGLTTVTYGQDSARFTQEVAALKAKYDTIWDSNRPSIVFTGSSSVRMWHDLKQRFPEHQIVNTGFGGSQASDLLAYSNELILTYNPTKVFIYEGDNDVAAQKRPKAILSTMQEIIQKVKNRDNTTQIVLISPKPSLARWNLRRQYKKLNRKLKRFGKKEEGIYFADVWNPMLNGRKVKTDIFLEDGLHMNTKGYDIWYKVLGQHME